MYCFHVCPAVGNGDLTITCSVPSGENWKEGPFTVHVTAQSESGLVGCNDVEVNDTSVNVYPRTDLTLTHAEDLFICSDSDADQDFNFTVTTTGTDPPPANVSLGEAANGGLALTYCQFFKDGQLTAGPLTFGEPSASLPDTCDQHSKWLTMCNQQ